ASRMGISQLPDVDFPVDSITITYKGAASEIIETDVIYVLADAVMTVEGVRNVASSARYGNASITVEFELNRDIAQALQDVQNKVAGAQRLSPRDIDPPVISKTNPEDQPIMWLALSSDRHTAPELMRYVKDVLKDRFSAVEGVGEILLGGYVDPNLRVLVWGRELVKYELAVTDVL